MHNLVTQASRQYSRLISEVDVSLGFLCFMKNVLCFIAFINIYIHTYIYIYIYIYIHTHTHTHTHVYIYIFSVD